MPSCLDPRFVLIAAGLLAACGSPTPEGVATSAQALDAAAAAECDRLIAEMGFYDAALQAEIANGCRSPGKVESDSLAVLNLGQVASAVCTDGYGVSNQWFPDFSHHVQDAWQSANECSQPDAITTRCPLTHQWVRISKQLVCTKYDNIDLYVRTCSDPADVAACEAYFGYANITINRSFCSKTDNITVSECIPAPLAIITADPNSGPITDDAEPLVTWQWSRKIALHVLDTEDLGWASIENGNPGDEVWFDRSFDGGRSWDPKLGDVTIPAGASAWSTTMLPINTARGLGLLRACGKAGDRPEISCTGWFGTDPASAPSDVVDSSTAVWWRPVALHVSKADGTGWASIGNGNPGDEAWLDRSFDRGQTWEPKIADTTIPTGQRGWRTLMRFASTNRGAGLLRACGKTGDRPEIACTGWMAP